MMNTIESSRKVLQRVFIRTSQHRNLVVKSSQLSVNPNFYIGQLSSSSSLPNSRAAASINFSTSTVPVAGVGAAKTSTGYVGMAVEPDWYNVMLHKFQHLLDRMEASDMPETAQYRIDVTKWCNYVIKTVKDHPNDPEAVEDAINMGQVEELIEMADDEMICMDVYLRTRMWELVEEANPAVDFDPDPMKDPMAEDGDPNVQEALRKGMEQKS